MPEATPTRTTPSPRRRVVEAAEIRSWQKGRGKHAGQKHLGLRATIGERMWMGSYEDGISTQAGQLRRHGR